MHAILKKAGAACLCGKPAIIALLMIATSTRYRKSLNTSGWQYKIVKLQINMSLPHTQTRSNLQANMLM